jgi:hypothetical protein
LSNIGDNTVKKNCLFVALFISASASVFAQNFDATFQITPYFALHGYTWKEFDDNGSEALKESGPRFSFGVLPRFSFLRQKNLFAEMDLQYTFGTVDYEGFTFDLQTGQRTPYTTQTAYSNFEMTTSAGYIVELSKMFQLTPVAGFAYEVWNRDIANGGPLGYDEKYSVFLGHIGVSGTYIVNNRFQFFAGFILKFPFSISETIDRFPRVQSQKFNVNISPGSNPRFAVQVGGSVYRVFAVFDFETWTLSRSPESQGLHQPESKRTHFGIKLGYTIGVI